MQILLRGNLSPSSSSFLLALVTVPVLLALPWWPGSTSDSPDQAQEQERVDDVIQYQNNLSDSLAPTFSTIILPFPFWLLGKRY